MSQTIGEKIREIRKARGLTQKELGEKAGIAEPTIRRYELGKLNPKIETVKKIADALGVDMNALYGDLVWDAVNNGLVSAGIERRMIADSSTEILEDSVKIQSYLSILTKAGRAKALERGVLPLPRLSRQTLHQMPPGLLRMMQPRTNRKNNHPAGCLTAARACRCCCDLCKLPPLLHRSRPDRGQLRDRMHNDCDR